MTSKELHTMVQGWGFIFAQNLDENISFSARWAEALTSGTTMIADYFADSTETTKVRLLNYFLFGVAEGLIPSESEA